MVMTLLPARDDLFRSLSDPTRRGLFETLCREGALTVGALTARAGVSQPAVSKHLAVLSGAGLVDMRPEGRVTRCRARPEALAPLWDWTREMTDFWENRMNALDDLLNRMDQ